MGKETIFHYMVSYFSTHQPDGVHLSARCTYGEKLEGIRQDEGVAKSM